MTYERRATVTCNVCGASVDVDPAMSDPFGSVIEMHGKPWKDWLKVDPLHHLCPRCAAAYTEKKAEMEQTLRRYAGYEE